MENGDTLEPISKLDLRYPPRQCLGVHLGDPTVWTTMEDLPTSGGPNGVHHVASPVGR